ncbi:hypothetical protein ENUP19_0215G0002 [Entamoeba nuttalli]|uniref:Leucine rich repeat protein, BspA family protein n=1 Tax=Entamoeba nuttalli TaxID=412467 RepID=A0ABQ0DP87_9EUKA
MLCRMLTYLSFSCNTCGSLYLLTQLKVLYLNKIIKSVDVESFYPTSLEFLQCYSNSLPMKLLITQLVLNDSLNQHNIQYYSRLCSLKPLRLISYSTLLPSSLTSLSVSCFGLSQSHISFSELNCINVKQLHIENCNTHNVELPSCLDSLYLHYSEFEITNPSIFYTLILNESKINGEMIQKDFIKNFYCKRSKESEFINIEWYLSLPQVKFCYCQK